MKTQCSELICVTGLTPQVVTETLYALGMQGIQSLPRSIHVLTTLQGRRKIQDMLLGESGQLISLLNDYGWNDQGIQFDENHIHVIRDHGGRELDDIRDKADNTAAADFIAAFIRDRATQPALMHVSLAGGRKTMGFFTGHALSLYGRPEDELSHVLVNAPFESHPDFFYPPAIPRTLALPDGTTISTKHAEVSLASVPFVRLQTNRDEPLVSGQQTFSEAVNQIQQLLDPCELVIDLTQRKVWLQGHETRLSPKNFIWLFWLAQRVQSRLAPLPFDEHAANDLLTAIDVLEGTGTNKYRDTVEEARAQLQNDPTAKGYFEQTRTKLNTQITEKSGLCPAAAERYQITSFGPHARTAYGLDLPPEAIHIQGEP